MDLFTRILWVIAIIGLVFSMIKDKKRTLKSMKMVHGMMKSILGEIIGILFLIGLILTFIPPETVKGFMEKYNIFVATLASAIIGSVTLIPAFVAFPLVGSFVEIGFGIVPSVAFLTTLTMVGVATFPLESREFGTRFAVIRNGLSFVFAIFISLIMGVLI